MRRKIMAFTGDCKHYIKEVMIRAINTPSLIYLPYFANLDSFTSTLCKVFVGENRSLVIVVECLERKIKIFEEGFGHLIVHANDIFSAGVSVVTYEELEAIQDKLVSSIVDKSDMSAIVFDDIRSIVKVLDVSETFKQLLSKFEISVALTSSPFLFYDYFRCGSKTFECYTPVLYDSDTSDYYRRMIEDGNIMYYEEDSCSAELLEHLQVYRKHPKLVDEQTLRFFIENNIYDSEYVMGMSECGEVKLGNGVNFQSEKLMLFFRVLESQSKQKTCIVFKDVAVRNAVYRMVLKRSNTTVPLDATCDMTDSHPVVEQLNGDAVYLVFSTLGTRPLRANRFDRIIFFDYLPVYSSRKRYILAPTTMKKFFQVLLGVEEMIEARVKPCLKFDTELLGIKNTEMGQLVEYRIVGGAKKLEEIKSISYKKRMVRRVTQRGEDVFVVIESNQGIPSTSSYLSRIYASPITSGNTNFVNDEVVIPCTSVALGVISSLTSFVNPKTFTFTGGCCDFRRGSLVLYMFSAGRGVKIKFHGSAIDEYIICDRRGSAIDIYFCLKIHPKMYLSNTNTNRDLLSDIMSKSNYKAQMKVLDDIDWRRCSIREMPCVKERFDIGVTFDAGNDLLKRFSRERSAEDSDNNKPDRFDVLDAFSRILNRFKCMLVFSSVKRSGFVLLSCEKMKKHLEQLDFSSFYYFLCLITKKQRYLSNQVSRDYLEKMMKLDARGFCTYLCSRLKCRFADVHLLIDKYRHVDSGTKCSFEVRSAIITPLSIVYDFPRMSCTNRVLREFDIDKFLRIALREETMKDKVKQDTSRRLDNVYGFYRDLLRNGVLVGCRKYFFLAMTTSQIRHHNSWFVTPYIHKGGLVDGDHIRSWLGDFSGIKNIGNYAMRLGQALSSTTETLRVDCFVEIEDVQRNGYVFTDGIGMISYGLAREMCLVLGLTDVPSAFQIRFAGYKGVVAVHPWLDPSEAQRSAFIEEIRKRAGGARLILRPSMRKFASTHRSLEVITYSSSMPFYLNREVIMILEALGVEEDVFFTLQDQAIEDLLHDLSSDLPALIRRHCILVPSEFASAHHLFYRKLLVPIANKVINGLCRKSRIFVPEGRSLMGVVDELGILEEGEAFIMVKQRATDEGHRHVRYGKHMVITSSVLIVRNPCLHPGDIRVVKCVDKQELHYLRDVVVFSKKGLRPIQNMCSGSDLDGDMFLVSWNADLIPKRLFEPDTYTSATFLTKETVSINDVVNFYIRYMRSFNLGLISNSHLAFGDSKGILSQEALMLATMFNKSVDFPKTGFLARVPESLVPEEYPDFMEQKYNSYRSRRTLGNLYRRVKCLVMADIPACECHKCLEKHMLFSPVVNTIVKGAFVTSRITKFGATDCSLAYKQYKSDILAILSRYNIRTEEEAFMNACDEEGLFHDLKTLISRHRKLNRTLDGVCGRLHSECTEPISSFPWMFLGAGMEPEKETREVFDGSSSDFIFNKKMVLVDKNDTAAWKDIGVRHPSDGFIWVYCDMVEYNKLRNEIPKDLIPHIREMFNLLLIVDFFSLDSFDGVFAFIAALLSIVGGTSKFHVSKGLIRLSSMIPRDTHLRDRLSFLKGKEWEEMSAHLMLVAFLLCFDINFVYKVSIVVRCPETPTVKCEKKRSAKRATRTYEVIVMGMFDSNDEIRLCSCDDSNRKGLFAPVLLNKGVCSIENYKDVCYDLIHGIINAEGSIHTDTTSSRTMLFSASVMPGRFYLCNVSTQFTNSAITINELSDALAIGRRRNNKSTGINYFMNNIHPLADVKARDDITYRCMVLNDNVKRIHMSLTYGDRRYDLDISVEGNTYRVKRVTKGRRIAGKMFLLGFGEWKDAKDIMLEMVSEEVVYEEGFNNVQDEESRLLTDDIISITDGVIRISDKVSGYREARVEIDVSVELSGSSMRLSKKRIYKSVSGESCLEVYEKKVTVSALERISSRNMDVEDIEGYVGRCWRSILLVSGSAIKH